jgi:hypothetical protein
MMLQKNWFRRRTAAAESQCEVVLDFFAVDLEAVCEHGTYRANRVGGDWEVRYRPKDALWDARDVRIDALDGDGCAVDWPSRRTAEDACRLHAHLLELGHSVGRATELVAQRSQRVAEHQRTPTIDYALPARP